MNFGSNSNVRVGGAVFHVQTEDRGPAHPFLDTVVYEAGRVVHKRSTSYQDLAGSTLPGDGVTQQIRERLAQQHREVIAHLEAGTLTLNTFPADIARATDDVQESLLIRLLNPTSWLALENVTLEVEVQRSKSAQPVAGTEIQAFLESENARSTPVGTHADELGRGTLKFSLPAAITEGSALVIRATDGERYGELRFRLKPRSGTVIPPLPRT